MRTMISLQCSAYLLLASLNEVWCYINSEFLSYPLFCMCVFICIQNLTVATLVPFGSSVMFLSLSLWFSFILCHFLVLFGMFVVLCSSHLFIPAFWCIAYDALIYRFMFSAILLWFLVFGAAKKVQMEVIWQKHTSLTSLCVKSNSFVTHWPEKMNSSILFLKYMNNKLWVSRLQVFFVSVCRILVPFIKVYWN